MKSITGQGLVGLANPGVLNGGNCFVGHFSTEVLSFAFLLLKKRADKSAEPLVLERIGVVINTHIQFLKHRCPKRRVQNHPD